MVWRPNRAFSCSDSAEALARTMQGAQRALAGKVDDPRDRALLEADLQTIGAD